MNFLDSLQAMDYALNRDRMRLKELSPIASFLLLVVVPIFALAASREKKPCRLLFPWHCFCSRFRSHAHSTSRRTRDG